MHHSLPACLLLGILLLTGCGQKGPLYLPEPEATGTGQDASDPPAAQDDAAPDEATGTVDGNTP